MRDVSSGPEVAALHEACHGVAVVLLGGRLRLLTVDETIARAGSQGCALHDPLPYRWQTAATLWTPIIVDGFAGARSDWERLIRIPTADVARGHVLATEIAARYLDAIERVAEELRQQQTLTRADVTRLVEEVTR